MPSPIPQRVEVKSSRGGRFTARIQAFTPVGVWVSPEGAAQVDFREQVRLAFLDGSDGALLEPKAEVVYCGDEGIGLEILASEAEACFDVVRSWAHGHLAQTADLARVPAPEESSEDLDVLPVPRVVLIVEDDAQIARMLHIALTRRGYAPVMARDAGNAIGFLETIIVHAVLLDWMLPQKSGQAVLDHVRKADIDVPIAVVSGAIKQQSTKAQVIAMGASEVFEKPFSVMALLAWVQKVAPDIG